MSSSSELVKNTLILGFGAFAAQIVGFLLLPLYTRVLSPSQFGFVDLVTVCFTLAIPALSLQMHMAAFRFLVEARSNRQKQTEIISTVARLVVGLASVWAVIIVGLGYYFNVGYVAHILAAGLSILFLYNVGQCARGLGNNLQFAIANSITAFTTLLCAFIFVGWAKMSVPGVFLALALANSAGAFYLLIHMRLWRYFSWSAYSKELRKEMLQYSVPLIPNGLSWWVNNAADRIIISLFLGTGANGVYAASSKFVTILNAPNSVFAQSWAESATVNIDSEKRDEFFSSVANTSVRLFGSLALVLVAAMPFLFVLFVDSEYSAGLAVVPVLIAGVCCNVVAGIYDAIYVAKKLSRPLMLTTIAASVLNIALNFILVPTIGIMGAAVATASSFAILAIVRHFGTRKYVTITYQAKTIAMFVVAALPVLAAYYSGEMWAQAAAFVGSCIIALWVNWSLAVTAVNKLRSKLRG